MYDENMANIKKSSAKSVESSIWADIEKKRFKEAALSCARLNREYPTFASGWHTMSYIAISLNNAAIALDAINRAVELEPDNAEWLLQKANCMLALVRLEEAKKIAVPLSEVKLTTAYQFSTLARIMVRLGLNEKALNLYSRAIALDPDSPGDYYNLATVQRSMGDVDGSEDNLNKCLELNPRDSDAYYLRSILRLQTPVDNHIDELKRLAANGAGSPRDAVNINYALAKELEDVAHYDESFSALETAAGIRRKHIKYRLEGDLLTIEAIKTTFSSEFFEKRTTGSDNSEPIFVLGMPRTGTTLVERILGSHSSIFSAGELNNFAHCLMELAGEVAGKKLGRDELVPLTATLDFKDLGERYIASTRNLVGHTAHFIDKLPINFLYVGLINLALPNAKIINLQRNPMDTCYAVYKSLFKDGYPFSYALEELGSYYVAYDRLMTHWNTVLPGVVHTVNYEDVVADIESEARNLIDCCGLDWQEQCLRFYENKQASTTASATQIRQPVYSSSVGKWRHYERQLQPVANILSAAGIDY